MTDFLESLRQSKATVAIEMSDPANNPVPTTFEEAYNAYSRDTVTEMQPGMPAGPMGPAQAQPVQVPRQGVIEGDQGGVGMATAANVIDDPDKTLDFLAEQSGIPREKLGFVEDRPVFVNDEGNFEAFTSDPAEMGGSVAAASPEMVGGIVGTVAGAKVGRPDVGSAVGAMAGLSFKKWLANLMFDDPIDFSDAVDVGREGALDALGSKLFRGVGKALTPSGVPGIPDLDPKALAREQDFWKQTTGIDLDVAQLTGIPQLKATKLWLRNFPGEAGYVIQAHEQMANGQAENAIRTLADGLARSSDPARVGMRATNVAQQSIEMARAEVDRLTGPLYKQAFADAAEQGLKVDAKPLVGQIDVMLKYAKGKEARWLREARKSLMQNKKQKRPKLAKDGQPVMREGKPVMEDIESPESSLQGLHQTKLALDEMLSRKPGDNALSKKAYRDITLLQKNLVERMRQSSPGYADAMDKFAKAQGVLVEPLERSVIGVLAKIPDHKAATAAASMFTGGVQGGRMTPLAISRARRQFKRVERENPALEGAWEQLTGDWIRQTLNKSLKPTATGEAPNVAGKWLKTAFGDPQQQAALKAAVGPDGAKNLTLITSALKKAASTPTASSATEFNRLITEMMGEGGVTFLQRVLRPRDAALSALENEQLDRMSGMVADALVNPETVAQLKKIRAMSDATKRDLGVLGLVFASGVQSAGEEYLTNEEGPVGE